MTPNEPSIRSGLWLVAVTLGLIVFMVTAGLALGQTASTGGTCDDWAGEINYPRNSYRMRQIGCTDAGTPGEYRPEVGVCAKVARQAARAGYRGGEAVQYVEAHYPTCYWIVDEARYGVMSTTT